MGCSKQLVATDDGATLFEYASFRIQRGCAEGNWLHLLFGTGISICCGVLFDKQL